MASQFFSWLPSFLVSFWSFLDSCILVGNVSLLGVIFGVGLIVVTIRALMVKG